MLAKEDRREMDGRSRTARHPQTRRRNMEPMAKRASFYGTDLSFANSTEVDLDDADLSGADFSDANLREAQLGGANLRGANFSRTNLIKADMWRANLSEAVL